MLCLQGPEYDCPTGAVLKNGGGPGAKTKLGEPIREIPPANHMCTQAVISEVDSCLILQQKEVFRYIFDL